MHCLADRSNQSVCSRWSQTLHGQPFSENTWIQTNHLSLACATCSRSLTFGTPT
jgi:hypothetical protein